MDIYCRLPSCTGLQSKTEQGSCTGLKYIQSQRQLVLTSSTDPWSRLPSCSGPEPKTPTCWRAAASIRGTTSSEPPGTGTGCQGCCHASGICTLMGTCMYLQAARQKWKHRCAASQVSGRLPFWQMRLLHRLKWFTAGWRVGNTAHRGHALLVRPLPSDASCNQLPLPGNEAAAKFVALKGRQGLECHQTAARRLW